MEANRWKETITREGTKERSETRKNLEQIYMEREIKGKSCPFIPLLYSDSQMKLQAWVR